MAHKLGKLFLKGHTPWNKGLKGKKPYMNLSGLTGVKKHSEKTKEKMRAKALGRKHTEESKKLISLHNKAPKGEFHHSWKGGKGSERHRLMNQKEYILWRTAVFMRDNYTCQICSKSACYLEADHIKSWSKYPELRYAIDNGRALCKECHKMTESYPTSLRGGGGN